MSHTGGLPLRCECCAVGYKEKGNLTKHVMKDHPRQEDPRDSDMRMAEKDRRVGNTSDTSDWGEWSRDQSLFAWWIGKPLLDVKASQEMLGRV